RLLTNVVLLLDWVDIHKVMDVLGGWSKDGALTRGQLARGASCLNQQIGMENPGRKAAGWGKLSHETLIDAFVLADYYCTLRSGLDMKPLYDFRDLLGLYINATVSPEEIMNAPRPVPKSEAQQPSNSTPVSTKDKVATEPPKATAEHEQSSPGSTSRSAAKEGGTVLLGKYTFTKKEYDKVRAAGTRYLPQPLETPENQMGLLISLSAVMLTFAAEHKTAAAWNDLKHLPEYLSEEDRKKRFLEALVQTILAVEQSLSIQTTESLRRRVMEAQPEELLRAWAVLDYYAYAIKPEYIANIRNYRDYIHHTLLRLENNKEDVQLPIEVKGTEIHINSAALTKWMTANLLSVECTLDAAMALSEKEPTISLLEDNIITREYKLQTENGEDFAGKYFICSIRIMKLHQGGPLTLAAAIDGFISDSPDERRMTLNDVGYRFEGHFLNCSGEAAAQRREMIRGQDLHLKGLKYPGYTTPGNVRLIGVCPECKKSFVFHGYAFYMGQQDVAYSDDGLDVCAINENIVDKENWKYEEDGKTFRYYNSFCCPNCAAPYIDYKNHHDRKVYGVSGCVLLGRKYYTDDGFFSRTCQQKSESP
ncbi:MAG: hypothetical protein II920_03710, partial [Clostridia bacterium]|nr:hypothetical protein [Clostridia bacterium]